MIRHSFALSALLLALPAAAQTPVRTPAQTSAQTSSDQPARSANATPVATTALDAILYGAKSANEGERLFGRKCAFCHIGPSTGKFMLGRRMAKDKAELPSRADLQAEYVKAVVRNGLVNMPPFSRVELTDRELALVADWLARKGHK